VALRERISSSTSNVSLNDAISGSTGRIAAASNALKPACVSRTCARSGISSARTKCRNRMISLSGLSPVLCGSATGPSPFTSTAPAMPYR
jgi:hypothetical protein